MAPKDYLIGKTIGSGSFGTVNLAIDRTTRELFAVKSATTSQGLGSLKNEAEIMQKLQSSYIVQYLGNTVGAQPGGGQQLNLFMEFMAGGSLSEIVDKSAGALSESVIKSYTKQILEGLAYLHRNNIVHGDIKCKNVLLNSSGNAKLADFGCARKLPLNADKKSSSSPNSICGTPLWMAPEVLRNEGMSFASDLWSLGCTVIEMATGKAPWVDEMVNTQAAIYKIAFSDDVPKFPLNLSKEGHDFLRMCLQRDPSKRMRCADLLEHPFITSSIEKVMSVIEVSSSPTSVLNMFSDDNDMDYNDYESAPAIGNILERRSLLSSCSDVQKLKKSMCSKSNKGWILVRSG